MQNTFTTAATMLLKPRISYQRIQGRDLLNVSWPIVIATWIVSVIVRLIHTPFQVKEITIFISETAISVIGIIVTTFFISGLIEWTEKMFFKPAETDKKVRAILPFAFPPMVAALVAISFVDVLPIQIAITAAGLLWSTWILIMLLSEMKAYTTTKAFMIVVVSWLCYGVPVGFMWYLIKLYL